MSDTNPDQLRPTEFRAPADVDEATDEAAVSTPHRASQCVSGDLIAGRYRLIRRLGEGGMGIVWMAHSLALGVNVAIKLIRPGKGDPDLASRMAREAQASATLGHPAIVRVYDHGATEAGDPFLVMELVEGETLAALLDREHKLVPTEAIRLLLPVVDGLRCAHERGIIHRDIKPDNVLIAHDALGRAQPKLLDFGIAKLEHQSNVSRLTQVGDVLGSPEFMSPEQARGAADIDARSDVWGLSVVLYEMLTGHVPFKHKNYNALMQAILHEKPVPTVNLGAGDRELWLVLAKGLEKSREKRWSSMSKLGEALAFWLCDRGVTEDVCGNSLRAVWLGGTLAGVARPRLESWADVSPDGRTDERALPTARLRFRRLRHRVWLALTPAVRIALAALGVFIVTLLLVFMTMRDEAPRAGTGAPELGSAAPAAPVPPPPAPTQTTPEVVPIEALPKASASNQPKKPAVRRAPPPPPKKRSRDYGL